MSSFISLTCLQTHNVTLAGPISDFVVAMGSDGRIVSQGTVADALAHDKTLAKGLKHEEEAVELDESEEDAETTLDKTGKLVVAEEVELGHVSRESCTCSASRRPHLVLTSCQSRFS